MRISDWSSDVCSSDLAFAPEARHSDGAVELSKVLVIGAGGVGSVAVHKMAQNPDIFSHITLASRRIVSCEKVAESVKARTGHTLDVDQRDADNVAETDENGRAPGRESGCQDA